MPRFAVHPLAALFTCLLAACSGSSETGGPSSSSSTGTGAGGVGSSSSSSSASSSSTSSSSTSSTGAATGGFGTGGGTGASGTGGAGAGGAGMGGGGTGGGSSTTCSVDGNPGECMDVSACAALADHTSTAGYCPGPANIECCTLAPNVADNPPIPAGYKLMAQADVTPAMTAWAVAILHDPTTYPIFSTATQMFGTLLVLARVEWHPPDFQNSVVHRGVTLYEHL